MEKNNENNKNSLGKQNIYLNSLIIIKYLKDILLMVIQFS